MSDLICKTVWKLRFKHIPEIYNSARCFSSRPLPRQAGATTTGLYGFDHLKSPKGFQRFVDEAIERSGELVGAISSTSSSAEIVRAMDEISDTVGYMFNVFALLCYRASVAVHAHIVFVLLVCELIPASECLE
uniref:Putative mitochondrial intermediate peptidase isoform X2 n=1 Tax=Rhizophora mucronata TaxID=61149 RepID=A0A2P2M050_RHIMU